VEGWKKCVNVTQWQTRRMSLKEVKDKQKTTLTLLSQSLHSETQNKMYEFVKQMLLTYLLGGRHWLLTAKLALHAASLSQMWRYFSTKMWGWGPAQLLPFCLTSRCLVLRVFCCNATDATARRYASASLTVVVFPSVCLSVTTHKPALYQTS